MERISKAASDLEVLHQLPGIIYRLNPKGEITFINEAGLAFLGYKESEVLTKPFYTFLPENMRAEVVRHYQATIAGGVQEEYYAFPFLLADGSITHFGQHVRLTYQNGSFHEAFAVAHCITHQHEQSEQLRLAHQRLRRLVGNLDDAILVEDEHSRIHLINQQFCKLFDIPADPDSLRGTDCSEAAEQSKHLFKDPDAFVNRINELLKEKKKTNGDMLEMVDGRILERSYIPVFIDDGYRGHLWKYTNISERILLQRRLEEQEEKYRKILENMELGVMEVDNEDRITRVYNAMCQLTGYSEEELIGRNASKVLLPEDADIDISEYIKERQNRQSSVYKTQIKTKKGDILHVLISGAPVTRKGEVIGSIGIHYDITELIETQQALKQQTDKAEAARRNEETLLRRVIHELQLPFDGLAGMIQQLRGEDRLDTSSETFKVLCEATRLLGQTISETVETVTRKTGRRTTLKHSSTDLSQVTSAVIALHCALDHRSEVEIDRMIDGEPAPLFHFPQSMLFQALMQLVTIARKTLWNGRVNMSYTVENQEHSDVSYVDFCVYARGTFAPFAEELTTGLQPQQRAENPANLDAAKDLIDQLDGEFMVDKGQSEELMIRASFEMTAAPVPLMPEPRQNEAEALIQKSRFLVVESSKLQREYIRTLFKKWNTPDVSIVDTAEEAIAMRKNNTFDLVLCDAAFGNRVISGIRAFEREKNIRPVKTALLALRNSTATSLHNSFDAVIQRPFKPAQLRLEITKVLQEKAADLSGFEAVFEAYFANDLTQLLKMVNFFDEGFGPFEDSLKRLDATGDLNELRAILHKHRPSFQMLGLEKSYGIASQLEEQIEMAKGEEALQEYPITAVLHCIREERKRLNDFVQRVRASGT